MTFGLLNRCFILSDVSTGLGVNEAYIKDLGLLQILSEHNKVKSSDKQ